VPEDAHTTATVSVIARLEEARSTRPAPSSVIHSVRQSMANMAQRGRAGGRGADGDAAGGPGPATAALARHGGDGRSTRCGRREAMATGEEGGGCQGRRRGSSNTPAQIHPTGMKEEDAADAYPSWRQRASVLHLRLPTWRRACCRDLQARGKQPSQPRAGGMGDGRGTLSERLCFCDSSPPSLSGTDGPLRIQFAVHCWRRSKDIISTWI
jgi:hypothetical protein